LPTEQLKNGDQGSVSIFVRAVGRRSPARDFLESCEKRFQRRFDDQFGALVRTGAKYYNHQRFRPLTGGGKPMWEFKEHDHRMYCRRTVTGVIVDIVLLSGWIKDKTRGREERNEINKAKNLLDELESES
jgi:hypothetical protein